ncbi:MAG: glutamate dehydrogenase [Myxococcota bacterium]|jgi:glutamate dehydrogenase
MPATASTKQPILDSLRTWKGSIAAEDRPLFADFVTVTVNRLRGPFLAHNPPRKVLAYLEEAFAFARVVPPEDIPHVKIVTRPSKGIAVFTSMPDQPFIVDTIRLFLTYADAQYWGGFNVVFDAIRDDEGRMVGVGEGGRPESLVMLEADAAKRKDFTIAANQLRENLTLASAMVQDFRPMTRAVERLVERCEVLADRHPDQREAMSETAEFLKWILRENFVFMGADVGAEPLGIQRIQGRYYGTPDGDWGEVHRPGTVRVRKSGLESPVHRAGRVDEIEVVIDEETRIFLRGMFTYRAITTPSRHVPILRRVLSTILSDQAGAPGSFRYKGIANVFDSLPTEFLFTATQEAIAAMVDLVFESEQQLEVGVTILRTGEQSAFCLVAMPRSQFGDDLRRALEDEIGREMRATYTDHGLFMGRYDTVLLYYYMTGVDFPDALQASELTERIRMLATPWLGRLWSILSSQVGESLADRLTDTYGRAFPEAWGRDTPPERAMRDLLMLDRLSGEGNVLADTFEQDGGTILRLYQSDNQFLTAILPVLDNLGLVVQSSYHTPVHARGGKLHIDTFVLDDLASGGTDRLRDRADLFEAAIGAVFDGLVSNDALNGLILRSGVNWVEVDVLRGYAQYCRQLGFKLGTSRVYEVLLGNPQACTALVALFRARFDPDLTGDRDLAIAAADEAVSDELRVIMSHDDDLVVSTIRGLMRATVRTNAYRTDRKGHYVSFKLDCSKVPMMGSQRPMFEIYVHNLDVEGVHLRYGKVARGGLRWSDRNDFRTEVLGLATTQRVKNVVIVPTGSKGGFLLKNPKRDYQARRQQADLHYQTFIRGLLDVTDNAVGGQIMPPSRVVRHDEDDPYLVVAADKGTAHLSDTANKISEEYGFWLGDAFASGGSNGYDHKEVGITARGAWVLVRRHFAELGKDPYSEPFTVVGIGDMGGDVFGNGLIESPHAKLVAAFNHLHLFIDPNPDPATSYAERKRLFDTHGGWDAYDTSLLSAGGGIYDRQAKSIELSAEAKELLSLEGDEFAPEAVIHAMLLLHVDLLWNGGIGTYVKHSSETNADADDRSNNAIRIDGAQLKARVVGEGGNLGFTQRGRIEAGGQTSLNTDFIDNSGGVDLSDHEVNLKILLRGVEDAGELSRDDRNALLARMTDEVADLVLANNDAHGRQLSRDQIRSREDIFQFGRAIAFIERQFGRDRSSLQLPTNDELSRRAERGEGLTRPELAMLSSWVKLYVQQALVDDGARGLPDFDALLMGYFPKEIQERYPEHIRNHMLANEIAVTVATTQVVADAGAAFIPMAQETTGASTLDIFTAYLKAQRLAGAADVRRVLEELRTSVSLEALYRAWVMVDAGCRELVGYWLSARGRIPTDAELDEMTTAADQVYGLQAKAVLARNRTLADQLMAEDIPEAAVQRVLKAQYLNVALMIWSEARRSDQPFKTMVIRHLAVARASRLQDAIDDLGTRPASGRWDPIALRILHSRYHQLLRNLVARTSFQTKAETVDTLEPFLVQGALHDVRKQVDELLEGGRPSVATLLVMEERVASAISRMPER